jgi:hypothetical protein
MTDMKFGKGQFSPVITLVLFPCLRALFWWLGYELRGICKEGAEQLEPHVQCIFHWLLSKWDLANYLLGWPWMPHSWSQSPKYQRLQAWLTSVWFILVYCDTKICFADSGWDSSKFSLKLPTNHF